MKINCGCIAFNDGSKCLDCWGTYKVEAKLGMQVVYVPEHCLNRGTDSNGNRTPILPLPDVEYGFVTSISQDFVFCRYFQSLVTYDLRTTANSEATDARSLYAIGPRDQEKIDEIMEELGYER